MQKRGGTLVNAKAYQRTETQGTYGLCWIQPMTPVCLDVGLRHLPLWAPLHKHIGGCHAVVFGYLQLQLPVSLRISLYIWAS